MRQGNFKKKDKKYGILILANKLKITSLQIPRILPAIKSGIIRKMERVPCWLKKEYKRQ